MNTTNESVSILQASSILNVTQMSIRNWIKTGYLHLSEDNLISLSSIIKFQNEIAGKEKLNLRANKSLKDEHNHQELVDYVESKIKLNQLSDDLGTQYEEGLSDSYRNLEGIYYTPGFIVEDMFKDLGDDLESKTFLDPCCGSGNFIIEAVKKGFKPENIYGFDTDPVAVSIAKMRLFDLTGFESNTILVADFLEESAISEKSFDYIYTNPPWGKKISLDHKHKYSEHFNAGRSTDTCSLFLYASLKLLNDSGKLGFLLPDSFFNIKVFSQARKTVLDYKIIRLTDYKKPFIGLMTKAQAIILSKQASTNQDQIICESNQKSFIRNNSSFKLNPNFILNFWTPASQAEVIERLYNDSPIFLLNNAKFALGVVTGNNKLLLKENPEKGFVPVFKGSDITKKGLKQPTNFIKKDLSKYQQAAPLHLYKSSEKLIYKFISSDLCFYYDTKKRLVLNSANFLVLNQDFPIKAKELTKLLNSDFMSWFFKSVFNTHKILKSDLQDLPLHAAYFNKYDSFSEKKYLEFLGIKKQARTYVLIK